MSLLLAVVLAASPDAGVPAQVLPVEGAFITAARLSKKDLEAMGPVTATWNDKKGEHTVKGVRLDAVLLKLGYSEGAMGPKAGPVEKHAGLRGAVVAKAADGFEAVFSIGELLGTLGSTQALLVWEVDGAPLDEATGPFRIAVTTDKRPSRSLYQVRRLEVVDLRAR
jgi:hypothetical protein